MVIQGRPFASFIIASPAHSLLISVWISLCRVRLKVLSQKRSRQVPETAPPPCFPLHCIIPSGDSDGCVVVVHKHIRTSQHKVFTELPLGKSKSHIFPLTGVKKWGPYRTQKVDQSKGWRNGGVNTKEQTNEWMNKKGGMEERRKVRNWIWKGDMYSAVSHSL